MPEYSFKNPPASQVTVSVQFLNNLAVAERRSDFYQLVKDAYPLVVMPELRSLSHDLSDYSLYSENGQFRLEISMSYFRLVSSPYGGFQTFGTMFFDALRIFSSLYAIEGFHNASLRYTNKLPVEPDKSFGDYFGIEVRIPGAAPSTLWAGQGMIAVRELDGTTLIELEPQFTDGKLLSYDMNLTFTADSLSYGTEVVEQRVNSAHEHLRRYFFSCLKPEYLEVLSGR